MLGKNLHGVDLSVRVLTTGFWPGQNAPPHINLARIPQQVTSPCGYIAQRQSYFFTVIKPAKQFFYVLVPPVS
jgi:hypothetical protein